MTKVSFNSYSHIQAREVKDATVNERRASSLDKGYEKRPGAASQLRQRLATIGAKISGALGRQRVESSAKQISGPMNAKAMTVALSKISEHRIASHSVARPSVRPSPGSVSSDPTLAKADASSGPKTSPPLSSASAKSSPSSTAPSSPAINGADMRDALTNGLVKALQEDRGGAMIDKADVENFSHALPILLGLKTGELSQEQIIKLNDTKSEIAHHLPPEVSRQFDQLMTRIAKMREDALSPPSAEVAPHQTSAPPSDAPPPLPQQAVKPPASESTAPTAAKPARQEHGLQPLLDKNKKANAGQAHAETVKKHDLDAQLDDLEALVAKSASDNQIDQQIATLDDIEKDLRDLLGPDPKI